MYSEYPKRSRKKLREQRYRLIKLSKIKSTVLVIFILLVVIFMLVYACTGDLINAVACGAIAILSLMLLVIYLFDDVAVILNNKNFDTHDSKLGD